MDVTRYIVVQAVQSRDNVLIPVWDERIVFEKTEMYGDVITIKGEYSHSSHLVECVYDLKNRTLSPGIELDYYPDEKHIEFKEGDQIFFESGGHRKLGESTIKKIVYEEYDLTIQRGKKMDRWYVDYFKNNNVEIDGNAIYAIKQWKPFYILENGKKIKWNHELFHKVNVSTNVTVEKTSLDKITNDDLWEVNELGKWELPNLAEIANTLMNYISNGTVSVKIYQYLDSRNYALPLYYQNK